MTRFPHQEVNLQGPVFRYGKQQKRFPLALKRIKNVKEKKQHEAKYYCDLNCLYARKILMEGKIDKERLEILLNRYTKRNKI
ncbi:hypothetical protein RCL_jg6240.t1 [Rhizophagus clarus]|uniref:Uncharacterized protein n=1 Tax=Rhizophagus clarus TaxID=94130 RepID=A0A8H3L2X6_9GLOM|nr:hypothetical protein RCL_jg6240.t1 [Rhizophagus clarus]